MQIAGDDAGAETQAARRLGQQHGIVAAGAGAQIQGLQRHIGTLGLAALVGELTEAGVQVAQQRQRVGAGAAHEAARPHADAIRRVHIVLLEHPAEVERSCIE